MTILTVHRAKGTTVHQLFEEKAISVPNNISAIFLDVSLSYQELNNRSNHLAKELLARGVKKGDVIAFLLERSVEVLVTQIAILKCGAAYLPLDKTNPLSRIQYCVNASNCCLIISDQDKALFENENIQWILTNKEPELFNSEIKSNPDIEVSQNDRAYIMFTSGSTGTPKGVEIPHRAIVRLVNNSSYISIRERDRVLQFAPLSFDASTFEIWAPLLNGATSVLYSGKGLDPNLLAREMLQNNVTIAWFTAALFHLIAARYVKAFEPLHTLLAGGDVLYPKIVNQVFETYPSLTIINGYGPTENTTFTCCHRMTINNRPGRQVPIGRAISGTSIHVLDVDKVPVDKGSIGELYTSGDGVALGYLDKEISNSAFFEDKKIAAGLIYRTGDFVRENNEGELEFVGRKDNQVKHRGFRISLEEIQHHLLELESITDAVVQLESYGEEKLLVAHLQLSKDYSSISSKYIKQLLAENIPDYLIPELIHINNELTINANGKIDKKAQAKQVSLT